ncbi:hypothetical protein LPY66_17875 [Dehalobacter sp. DCM]|uniref:hypothetical protein n=1 Tax=Dehalobacter sp. DCM TaxID=2907827 RepID=UPI003081BF43|nr:hypothetical protein LPY66_17875 [Dehalobacter sp. DCM]
MDREEYLKMSETEKFKYLNKQATMGINYNKILEDIGMTKDDLARDGHYYIGNKFIRKPPMQD